MSVLILGLDAFDSRYADEIAGVERLDQNLTGANALYTYRVWPAIFAGTNGGESNNEYKDYSPENPYVWEKYPSKVFLAPVRGSGWSSENQSAFPSEYMEAIKPYSAFEEGFSHLKRGVFGALDDDWPLVIGCTRALDMVGHLGRKEDDVREEVVDFVQEARQMADEWLIVSDHGHEGGGATGIGAHTRDAVFGSSFCDYDSMSNFIEGWQDDLDEAMREKQLKELGYR